MWRQFVNLKLFLDRQQRPRHIQVILYLNLYHIWFETILYLLVNNINLMLILDRTYEFTIGMTILYLEYLTYDQMDFCFC